VICDADRFIALHNEAAGLRPCCNGGQQPLLTQNAAVKNFGLIPKGFFLGIDLARDL
jgi:hypothetical protein